MAGSRRPDIVVGIDIGQTCSGVAYSIGPDWNEPRSLNRWPAAHGIEKADKVATRVGYTKDRGVLRTWGFQSVFSDQSATVREQFKLTLDAEYQDDRGFSCDEARRWYCDYLSCLHREIEAFFDESVPKWRGLNVEYSFSTPTTWRNPAMIASIEGLIKSAGFASTRQQSVRMALTEAEAAAIEASTTRYTPEDVFLICDAGGGTTDVNLLKVKSVDRVIELQPLDHVEGVSIGSTLIDYRMTEHIVRRLELIKDQLEGDIYHLAEEMLMGKFQTVKHSFPNPVVDQIWLDVKGLPGTHTFPEADIQNSRMAIDRSALKEMFDQQIQRIFALIDGRLLTLQEEQPHEQVSYIILSGGFGSSPYLFEEVRKRYEMNYGFRLPNAASIRIMRVLEPQLAVVRGLVRERTQQLGVSQSTGTEVFQTRRCRNSYGIVVRSPYDVSKHKGMQTVTGVHDGRKWVDNLVDWFIVKGQEISVSEGIRRAYGTSLSTAEHHLPRRAQIVMSTLPAEHLPRQSITGGCQNVAEVTYRLTDNDMQLKNGQAWNPRKKYWKADFSFVVQLGPADLKFQILGMNGVLSTDHSSLEVDFLDPSETVTTMSPQARHLPGESHIESKG